MPWTMPEIGGGLGLGGLGALVLKVRQGRAARADAIFEKVMARMGTELDELRLEVADCKRRDARVYVIELGLRLTVGELKRVQPENNVLSQVLRMLHTVPEDDGGEWAEFIHRIDHADEQSRGGRHGENKDVA